ncbi:MAG: phosphatase PAP2 family protein [Planctomycetota bacterium]
MITSHLLLTLVLAGQVTQVAPESLGIPGERPGRSWVEEAEAESSPSDVLPWITRPVDPTEFTRLPPIDGASEPIDWLGERPQQLTVWQQISSDYRNFYSTSRLGQNLFAFGVAASFAETNADEWVRKEWQNDVRSSFTDSFANSVRWMGEWTVMAPAGFGAWALAEYLPIRGESEGAWREWSRRTGRAYLVGCPAMLVMQRVTGGSRPGETDHGSKWHPFADSNGVSGHAFTGAVPFMAAAQMTDDWRWKALLYAGSTLPGLSRLNDDKHYSSQVFLGLWIAYVSTQSVHETQVGQYRLLWAPSIVGDGIGLSVFGSW